MPRQSAASLSVVRIQAKPKRLEPPDNLDANHRRRFVDISNSVDEKHFRASDMPLLVQYVYAAEQAEHAIKQMEAGGGAVVDGKVSPWLTVHTRAVKTMTILATRLRLSPQSRTSHRTVQRQTGYTPHSAYDEEEDD